MCWPICLGKSDWPFVTKVRGTEIGGTAPRPMAITDPTVQTPTANGHVVALTLGDRSDRDRIEEQAPDRDVPVRPPGTEGTGVRTDLVTRGDRHQRCIIRAPDRGVLCPW